MNDAQFAELVAWIADEGLAGEEEPELVSGFCTRAVAFGLPLTRAAVLIGTLHPLYEGHFFGWRADGKTCANTAPRAKARRRSVGSEVHSIVWWKAASRCCGVGSVPKAGRNFHPSPSSLPTLS
jgi:adenylate cyclase